MAILAKDWHQPYTSAYMGVDSYTERATYFMYLLKEGLLSHPTSPWTVVASSNGSVASLADNWSSVADVVRGTNDTWVGSWIVMKTPPGSGTQLYLRIDYTSTTEYSENVWMSPDAPDLSALSPYRVPQFSAASPVFGRDQTHLHGDLTGSLHRAQFCMAVASDGSFVATSHAFVSPDSFGAWPIIRSLFVFNRLKYAHPLDPYGFVLITSDTQYPLRGIDGVPWTGSDGMFSLHPDGTPILCAACWSGGQSAAVRPIYKLVADDFLRDYRPLAEPIPIVSVTSGKTYRKGELEDLWLGAYDLPPLRWGQPGFDGTDMTVAQKGILWVPCTDLPRY